MFYSSFCPRLLLITGLSSGLQWFWGPILVSSTLFVLLPLPLPSPFGLGLRLIDSLCLARHYYTYLS